MIQDTSWSRYVPSGEGLIAFETVEQAAAGLERIQLEYVRNQEAAYQIAHDYFSPSAVLSPLLENIMRS